MIKETVKIDSYYHRNHPDGITYPPSYSINILDKVLEVANLHNKTVYQHEIITDFRDVAKIKWYFKKDSWCIHTDKESEASDKNKFIELESYWVDRFLVVYLQ